MTYHGQQGCKGNLQHTHTYKNNSKDEEDTPRDEYERLVERLRHGVRKWKLKVS